MRKLSLNEQGALNIIGSLLVVVINVAINFVLSPYIVEYLGIEANGYITLANNFISYIALITMALNSMAGRFILIEYRRGNQKAANEYYSSVLFGDWILAFLFIFPMTLFIIHIDEIINLQKGHILDTQILFAIVFLNYLVPLCLPQWQTATYCTNNLYLRSLKNAITTIVRAVIIYLLFFFLKPHSYYVAIAASVMTFMGVILDYLFYTRLMPEMKWHFSNFRIKKVKELISSGIWNTISQCGNLLLEGLDILIANIFINPIASGMLALSKIIPNMITQITGTVATTYGPRLTYLYADSKFNEMEDEINNDITIISFLANIPIGVFIAFGIDFYALWVPSQNAFELYVLSCLTLVGLVFAGISQCFVNIFGIVNKLKLNSIVIIATGLLNILIVYVLLRFTTIGVLAIVSVSSVITIVRLFAFTAPYAASCINASGWRFCAYMIKGACFSIIPIVLGFLINCIPLNLSWLILIIKCGVVTILSLFLNFIIFMTSDQRHSILCLFRIKK